MQVRQGGDGPDAGAPAAPAEDHSWAAEADDAPPAEVEPPPVKVGHARHPKVPRVRGARRR